MSADAPGSLRRLLVIDDAAEIHADFRKILMPAERSPSLAAAKAALFGVEGVPARAEPRPRFALDSALQGEEGVALARAARMDGAPYEVAFVDMRMPPGWDGMETIGQLWLADPQIQVVICTAYSDHSLDSLGERFGQSDKLLVLKKPFEAAELVQLASTLSEKWRTERRVERKVADLEHGLRHDRLTGLPNRMLLTQRLEACIARRRHDPELRYAVLYLDCDGFKLVNDSLGHDLGDQLLIEIADRLRQNLRATDLVSQANSIPSRVGGDEFLVLIEDLRDERDSAIVAQRLIDQLGRPYEIEGHRLSVSFSIGIATCDRPYENAGEIVRDADTAMYRGKAEGGSSYAIFDEAMHEEVKERLALLGRLREAVRDQAITLHFQPIVRLADSRLAGFEALARWNHPERGPVAPDQFIALAEETGLIKPLGASVMRKACEQLAAWRRLHPEAARGLRMSVNVSRKQLADGDLATLIERTLEENALEPESLVVEITESLFMHGFEGAARPLRRLQELGLEIHLDDFGTGYSSLIHLYRLPMAALKIDRAFVAGAGAERSQQRVLEAIVTIARTFGMTLIGEGIETVEQLNLLRHLGVDLGQGYLFGRPTTAEAAERLLAANAVLVPVGS